MDAIRKFLEQNKIIFLDRKFSRREKISVSVAACVLFVFILVELIINPIIDKRETMQRSIKIKEASLKRMVELKAEYDVIKQKASINERQMGRRENGFTLFSFLEKLAGEAGVKDNIDYMKPTSSTIPGSTLKRTMVEVKLNGITMEQLTKYLHGIETSRNIVFVKRLSIAKKGKQDTTISAVFQAETTESS